MPFVAETALPPSERRLTKHLWVALGLLSVIGPWTSVQVRNRAAARAAPLPGEGVAVGPCTLWFVGSSTVAGWDQLPDDMKPWAPTNRGIPGAQMPEINHRLAQQQPGTSPQALILYAGENDIAEGRSVAQVLNDLRDFLAIKTRMFGAIPVVLISLKPSPARWQNRAQQIAYNAAARAIAAQRSDVRFVDVEASMLIGGRPGPFYIDDGLHMNAAGYTLWSSTLRPVLREVLTPETVKRCDKGHQGRADDTNA
jgi:hypothetical protein